MLHGDETGALLGATIAEHWRSDPDGRVLASSIVSSRLLERIADDAGLGYAPTLTGFKWLSRVDGLVFGYEEALGYCVDPENVHDKDGISAALVLATLAARLRSEGRTFVDALDDLARRHGLHLSGQVSGRFDDAAQIAERVEQLRQHPPATLGGSRVESVVDLATGSDADRRGLPPTEGVRLTAADGTRVVVRPSGTEPKVKCYLEVVEPVAPEADVHAVGAARRAAADRMRAVEADVRAALRL
jgi:phosphomannomutase